MASGSSVQGSAASLQKALSGQINQENQEPPGTALLIWLLSNADTKSPTSPTHRIGIASYDAAAGNHKHTGQDSAQLFDLSDTVTGDLSALAGQRTAIKGIIRALTKLGLTDSTTN